MATEELGQFYEKSQDSVKITEIVSLGKTCLLIFSIYDFWDFSQIGNFCKNRKNRESQMGTCLLLFSSNDFSQNSQFLHKSQKSCLN